MLCKQPTSHSCEQHNSDEISSLSKLSLESCVPACFKASSSWCRNMGSIAPPLQPQRLLHRAQKPRINNNLRSQTMKAKFRIEKCVSKCTIPGDQRTHHFLVCSTVFTWLATRGQFSLPEMKNAAPSILTCIPTLRNYKREALDCSGSSISWWERESYDNLFLL